MRLGVNSYEWVICPLSEDGARVTHFVALEDYVARRLISVRHPDVARRGDGSPCCDDTPKYSVTDPTT